MRVIELYPKDVKTPRLSLLLVLTNDQLLGHEFIRGSHAQHGNTMLKTNNTMVVIWLKNSLCCKSNAFPTY